MPSFVFIFGCLMSAACLARGHFAAAVFMLAWHVVLAFAARAARTKEWD